MSEKTKRKPKTKAQTEDERLKEALIKRALAMSKEGKVDASYRRFLRQHLIVGRC